MDNKLIIVDTEAAVAFGSGKLVAAFVVELALPGVFCVPLAIDGPAAFDRRVRSSDTKPDREN